MSLAAFSQRLWYGESLWRYLLWPLTYPYRLIVFCRKQLLKRLAKKSRVPVIVVGNISVGGSGKTPTVVALTKFLSQEGYRVGIVSRGYGAKDNRKPIMVGEGHHPAEVGDEPLLISQLTGSPVVICKNRPKAIEYLLTMRDCDIVLSDDGLSHYRMARDIEVIVCGDNQSLGNRLCFPAGPLREPMARLKKAPFRLGEPTCDWSNFYSHVEFAGIASLETGATVALAQLKDKPIKAYCAIANPQRFFNLCRDLGLDITPCAYPDHTFFKKADFNGTEGSVILMTEKDAVKCRKLGLKNSYYIKINVNLDKAFKVAILKSLGELDTKRS